MSAYEYLITNARQRIEEQLQNAVVVWINGEIVSILKRDTDKKQINKVIKLAAQHENVKIETY